MSSRFYRRGSISKARWRMRGKPSWRPDGRGLVVWEAKTTLRRVIHVILETLCSDGSRISQTGSASPKGVKPRGLKFYYVDPPLLWVDMAVTFYHDQYFVSHTDPASYRPCCSPKIRSWTNKAGKWFQRATSEVFISFEIKKWTRLLFKLE